MTARTLGLMIGLAALLVATPVQMLLAGDRDSARAAVDRGQRALARREPRTARVELMNAIAADPDWAVPHVVQARVMLALGDGAGALAEVERAQAAGGKDSELTLLKAHALLLQGTYDATLTLLADEAAVGFSRSYSARLAGIAHQMRGETGEAETAFDSMLRLAPRDPESWTALARFRLSTGDQAGAFAAAGKAVALAPRRVEPLALQAVLIRDQYGLMASLPWFDRALKADPNHVPLLEDYAATLLDAGQAAKALSVTRRIIGLESRNPRAFFLQALLAARAGDMALSRALVERIGGRLDGVPAMMLLRGVLQIEAGNAALAVAPLEALVGMQPENRTARTVLARAYGDAGRADDALAAIRPVSDRADGGSYAWTLAARMREATGEQAKALHDLTLAARPVPGVVAPLPSGDQPVVGTAISAIRALVASGQTEAAVTQAKALAAANPGTPASHAVLGDALLAVGRANDAAVAYEKAANLRFSEDIALRLMAAWRHAGRPERAERVLGLYVVQYPASLAAQRLTATRLMEAQDWTGAIALMDWIDARIGHRDALLLADLATAWLERGDAGRAVVYARRAYALQPASPVTADIYGLALAKAGQGKAGLEYLEKALALAPGNPLVHAHIRLAQASMKGAKG